MKLIRKIIPHIFLKKEKKENYYKIYYQPKILGELFFLFPKKSFS